jgi:3-mercaptopyruvate sulfurtransferase SseA
MTDHGEFLVETDWLHEHLGDPRVRVVDVRDSVPPVPGEGGRISARRM